MTQNEWQPIESCPAINFEDYLVADDGGDVGIGCCIDGTWEISDSESSSICEPLFWMPMPEHPWQPQPESKP